MKFGVISTGSRGDVQPFVALSLALIKKGHEVTLMAPQNFKSFIDGFGIPYIPVTGDAEQIINSPDALRLLEGGNILRFFYHLQKIANKFLVQQNREILAACKDLDNLIVGVLPFPFVYSIAEKYNKKCAVVFLSLPPITTGEFPYAVFGISGPRWFNRLSYKVIQLGYFMVRKSIDQFRNEIGLPKNHLLRKFFHSNVLTILPMTRELVKQPTDWPSNSHVTGFFNLPEEARKGHDMEKVPAGLGEWLANGERPVYIGFGSIPIPNHANFYKVLKDLLDKRRVIVCLGWSILNDLPKSDNLFVIKNVNHDWLLPHCLVAVIHGGIGTVCTVMRAGIPMVVVSVLADQPIYGKIIAQRKLGYHIPFKSLSSQKLISCIDATQSREMLERCKQVSERVMTENGTEEAVELIEQYFACHP